MANCGECSCRWSCIIDPNDCALPDARYCHFSEGDNDCCKDYLDCDECMYYYEDED